MSMIDNLGMRLNTLLTGVLIIVTTILLAWLSTRTDSVTDWTDSGRHTLSEASQLIISQLEAPIEVTAYAREQPELRSAISRFVERYQRVKPDTLLRFVNPDAVPDELRQLEVNANGEMVIHYQGRSEHVRTGSEEEFTNALQRLKRGSEHWLAFSEGHGERNPLGSANHDIGEFGLHLSQRGFNNQPVNLMQLSTLPNNTSVLIIAGPLTDFLTNEVETIINYVHSGGNLLWLAEPNNLYGLDALAGYLGLEFPQGTVIDISGQLVGINEPTITLISEEQYTDHPALVNFDYTSLFPRAASIINVANDDWTVKPLLKTSELSWRETGDLKGEVDFNADSDIQGPLTIALSLERNLQGNNTQTQRVIVVGDSDFLSNSYIGNSGNLDLGMRLLNWLSHDEDFINIPARLLKDTQLEMSQLTAGIIGFGFLLVLPLGFLATGVWFWWRRKNL
jgi:ABC-type uncharacterized transport system involved in gliding motility auxiliary subunit